MILLLDTQLVLWATFEPERLSTATHDLLDDPAATLTVSAASVWEIAIKAAQGRPNFTVDADGLRSRLLSGGWTELPVSGEHGIAAAELPMIHRDPFDRVLIAQARVEGAVLLTADRTVAKYGSPVRLLGD